MWAQRIEGLAEFVCFLIGLGLGFEAGYTARAMVIGFPGKIYRWFRERSANKKRNSARTRKDPL